MKIYIINLKRRPERLQKIISSLEQFNFYNYVIIDAIDGLGKSYSDVINQYDRKSAKRMQRELTVGEICTALSHQKAYSSIVAGQDSHGIVIEDDCPITQELIDFCNGDTPVVDICLLGYYTSNENNKCLVYKEQTYDYTIMDICSDTRVYFTNNVTDGKFYEFDDRSTTVDFLHGAHCYCLSKQGAKQLIHYNYPVKVEADNTWNYTRTVKPYGIRPMLVEISRDRSESDLEKERKLYQDTYVFDKRFINRIRSTEFGT